MNILFIMNRIYVLQKFVGIFDPNDIRKYTNYTPRPKLIKLKNPKYNLLVDTTDHIGFTSFIRNEPFEMTIYKFVEKLLPTDKNIILDIGANIGSASIPICKKYNLELVAIEASKEIGSLLAQNIVNNGIRSRLLLCALSLKTQKYIELFVNKGNTGSSSIMKNWNPSFNKELKDNIEYVPVKTIDQILENEKINSDEVLITKIDVEGAEAEVLKGGSNFLKSNSAPIILEYRLDLTKKYLKTNMDDVVNTLTRTGYEIFSITKDYKVANFEKEKIYENIIAIKKSSKFFMNLINK